MVSRDSIVHGDWPATEWCQLYPHLIHGSVAHTSLYPKRHGTFPPKTIAHSPRGSGPHLTYNILGPPESLTQTVSVSVQPFSYGSQMLCCIHSKMHC